MDVFSRTFLPATSEAGLPIPVVSRHMPVLRRCVTPEETTLLVARCQRIGTPMTGTFLLLLTSRRLVVSKESRLLHRVQLHLAAPLRDLSEVEWLPDGRGRGVDFAALAPDGVPERFWLPLRDPLRVRQVDVLFGQVFRLTGRPGTGTAPAHRRAGAQAAGAQAAGTRPAHTLATA